MEGNRNEEKLSLKLKGREGGKMALPEGHFSRCFPSARNPLSFLREFVNQNL